VKPTAWKVRSFAASLEGPSVWPVPYAGRDEVPRREDEPMADLFAQSLEGNELQEAWFEGDASG
jgi:hypothetical protein